MKRIEILKNARFFRQIQASECTHRKMAVSQADENLRKIFCYISRVCLFLKVILTGTKLISKLSLCDLISSCGAGHVETEEYRFFFTEAISLHFISCYHYEL